LLGSIQILDPSLLIVVPTLNSYTLLPRLLRSLQEQTWPHWKLLFIDGHSSPEHRRWLEHCCTSDLRCCWVEQDLSEPGIFGAMNQGFKVARSDCWLLFWGSDDWAATPTVLAEVVAAISAAGVSNPSTQEYWPDLLVCRARYVSASSGALARTSAFHSVAVLNDTAYRRSLLFGSTPPHQATLFGPGARRLLRRYSLGFSLSADLDYFLRLSMYSSVCVHCLDLELVHMADDGVSGRKTHLRLREVQRAYCRAFGWLWWFPFFMRYARRFSSLLYST
jgi:glycosyltransferase involved in cell wall biosynthesis